MHAEHGVSVRQGCEAVGLPRKRASRLPATAAGDRSRLGRARQQVDPYDAHAGPRRDVGELGKRGLLAAEPRPDVVNGNADPCQPRHQRGSRGRVAGYRFWLAAERGGSGRTRAAVRRR